MKRRILYLVATCLTVVGWAQTECSVTPVASYFKDESPSRAEYFSWINNTNEGPTEAQTLVNLDFFEWMRKEYGMQLDIYAFDAGLIDSKNIYGSMDSERFRRNFPKRNICGN